MPGLETGLSRLDDAIGGVRGLGVIGGVPGVGKTTLGVQVGCVVARNAVPFHFVSLEMFGPQLTTMLAGNVLHAERRAIERKGLVNGQADAWNEWLDRTGDFVYIRESSEDVSVKAMRAWMSDARCVLGAERSLLVVDSLQHLGRRWAGGRKSLKDALDDTMDALYQLAADENVAILVISHVPKTSGRALQLFSYSGSGGIDYTADVTMMLEADRRAVAAGKRTAPVKLSILKNRFGPPAEIKLRHLATETRFEEGA